MAEQKEEVIKVCITGAAGQIGYSILPLFATGQVFGVDKKVQLNLLEITPVLPALNGVRMELDDCAYPLVDEIVCTDKADVAFKDVDYAVLVGGFPRKKGMERKDLMAKNAPIFKAMGEAIEKNAKKTVKVLVVANPANTNCLICASHAPSIPKKNFCALTRLDFNRARAQIAQKLGVKSRDVLNVVIWGNHSATQVPDVNNATVNGKPAAEQLDAKYLKEEFIPCVQQRGKAIIEARGFSSALSAANGAKDCLRDWVNGTPDGQTVAMAVYSDGSYGIAKGLFYSFPCTAKGGEYTIVTDYKVTDEMKELMKASEKELLEEKAEAGVKD
mmetsp:Transcript_75612/g.120270  ORF Transcript_75612/g.120270 Transcript_75612/m.120270 type:complete len:330 (+) Transcript_75612:111-1100(+)